MPSRFFIITVKHFKIQASLTFQFPEIVSIFQFQDSFFELNDDVAAVSRLSRYSPTLKMFF
jgi:hypothetical protein